MPTAATPRLRPLAEIEPAVYNPRKADQQRLEFLKLSLRKLGFLLPLYATPTGHLLSGHQRSLCAELLGGVQVPVADIDLPDHKVRNINLVFNRATNDFAADDGSDEVWGKMSLENITRMANELPDLDPDSPDFFRCLHAEEVPLTDIAKHVAVPYEAAAMSMCSKLQNEGIRMPVVMTRPDADGTARIVNGQYRVMAALDLKGRRKTGKNIVSDTWPVVYISDEEADLSDALLNLISMKFTVEEQYADQLRFGAFRRASNVVNGMLPAYRVLADNGRWRTAHEALEDPAAFWNRFRQFYGESICDFGAGQRRTRIFLENKGIHVSDWEPYPLDWQDESDDTVNKAKPSLSLCRAVTDRFLADVKSGRRFSTVGLPAVLNSVPFKWDRMCVLAVTHALVDVKGQLVGTCRRDEDQKVASMGVNRARQDGKVANAISLFKLDYEPGVIIGDINVMPKVQKLHKQTELERDLGQFYAWVRTQRGGSCSYFFHAKAPKRVNPAVLKAALMHEFDLPYENGERIGRAEAALDAFGTRLGIDFGKVKEVENPHA